MSEDTIKQRTSFAYDHRLAKLTVGDEVIVGKTVKDSVIFTRSRGGDASLTLRLQVTSKHVPFLRERLGDVLSVCQEYETFPGCFDYNNHAGFSADMRLDGFTFESGDASANVPNAVFHFSTVERKSNKEK